MWSVSTGSYIQSSPAVAHGALYIDSEDDSLYAYRLRPGTAPAPVAHVPARAAKRQVYGRAELPGGIPMPQMLASPHD